jgi:hypothetical protein
LAVILESSEELDENKKEDSAEIKSIEEIHI